LKSDTSAGSVDEENENPQEVRRAMMEMDQFMRCFSMISEIIETPEIGIHLKSPEEMMKDEFEITADVVKKMKMKQ